MAAQQLTQEQQAIVTLQNELGQVRGQVGQITAAYDALKTAHETLNLAAANASARRRPRSRQPRNASKGCSSVSSSTCWTRRT